MKPEIYLWILNKQDFVELFPVQKIYDDQKTCLEIHKECLNELKMYVQEGFIPLCITNSYSGGEGVVIFNFVKFEYTGSCYNYYYEYNGTAS